jgi:hypothetical protein
VQIKFTVKGLEEIKAYIAALPRGVKVAGMRAFTTYILGDESHGLRHMPAYKYVSRAAAGYKPMTPRQRAWFWANGGPDMIGNNRTGATSEGWQMSETSDWSRVNITNNADGVGWTMGEQQARQPAMVGWRKYLVVIASNLAGGMRAANAAVAALLAKKG